MKVLCISSQSLTNSSHSIFRPEMSLVFSLTHTQTHSPSLYHTHLPVVCFVDDITDLKVESQVTSRSSVVGGLFWMTRHRDKFTTTSQHPRTRSATSRTLTSSSPIICPTGVENAPNPKKAILKRSGRYRSGTRVIL